MMTESFDVSRSAPKLSVVLPAYNEGPFLDAIIRRLYASVRSVEPSFEIVLVNNGSKDKTPEVARALAADLPEVRVVDVYPNQGYGNGLLQGLAVARGEILGWMHADEQATPEHLLETYRMMSHHGFDLAKVVRVQRDEPVWRILQSKVYNAVFALMYGYPFNDVNGSPKLFTRSLYERVNLSSKEWFIDPELMLKAGRLGAKIGEHEIIWKARQGGKSKVHFGTMLHFFKQMPRYRYRNDV